MKTPFRTKLKITFLISIFLLTLSHINAQRIGDPGWTFDVSKNDSDYPKMERWSKVGVRGGIPLRTELPVIERLGPGTDIQKAIDRTSTKGGGVVFLEKGIHILNKEIRMKSGVILRGIPGQSIVRVTLRGTNDKYAIIFDKVSKAGLEDLKFTFPVSNASPQDDRNNPTNKWCRKCHENDPNGIKNLYVTFVRIENDSNDNWVDNCEFIEAGTNPIKVDGNYNTFRDNLIDGSYNKGGGGEGYYDVRGHDNLFYNETVKRIRHFAIQQGADHNVVFDCNFVNTDINFHNKDDGNNLIEKNKITIQRWRSWGAFATGGAQYGHKPPGPNNIIYNNTTDVKGKVGEFGGSDKVFIYNNFGNPKILRSVRPKGGVLYAIKHIGNGNNNQLPTVVFKTLKNGDQFAVGTDLKPIILADDNDGNVANVKLYINNDFIRQETHAPYEWGHLEDKDAKLKNLSSGTYKLKAIAEDNKGGKKEKQITITIGNPIASGRMLINGVYTIRSRANNENVMSPNWDNFNVRMYSSAKVFSDHKWEFKHLSDGKHTVRNIGTGRFLEVYKGECGNRKNVNTWTSPNSDHQKWYVEKHNDSYFLIPVHCEDQALDKNNENGANVHTWTKTLNNKNQQFDLISVSKNDENATVTPNNVNIESNKEFSLTIFPNPVTNTLKLALDNFMGQTLRYTIFSPVTGSKIYTNTVTKDHGTTELIHVGNLETGLYAIRLKTENNYEFIHRFVIHR